MAANPKSPVGPSPVLERYHLYHAEAHILSGELEHPIKQDLEKYGHVSLEHTRRESHNTRTVGPTGTVEAWSHIRRASPRRRPRRAVPGAAGRARRSSR